MTRHPLFHAAAAVLWFVPVCHAADVVLDVLEPSVIEERFFRLSPENAERAATLNQIFHEAGCPEEFYAEVAVKGAKLPNITCTIPGSGDGRVVVTAHYDKVKAGQGAIDNWSGSALLPSLYQTLALYPRNYSYVFLLTTDEEAGLVGSKAYVKGLSKEERAAIVAEVNLDSVGMEGPVEIWANRADPGLYNAAVNVGSALGIPVTGMNIDKVGDTDSHPFVDKKIPVIDFHSLNSETIHLIHSKEDVPEAIDQHSYYETYRLVSFFLGYLDSLAGPVSE